tara:strand:+ start:50648 stop:51859 length:1212 start_codon:yes stop_codon:yes gene_type:complete
MRIIIVGGGQAGLQVISSLRRGGSKDEILLIGEEDSLPYQRPPLSKAFLEGDFPLERIFFKKGNFFQENSVDIKLKTRVNSINKEEKFITTNNKEDFHYDKLILATGSRLRKLKFEGSDLLNIHYLRTLEDSLNIKKCFQESEEVAIVGAGYIGLEVASVATKLGKKVNIIEMAPRIMNRTVDPYISEYFHNLHEENGVSIHLNSALKKVLGKHKVEKVIHGENQEINAQCVIIGAGVLPNSIIAEQSGLDCENGIIVNEYGETSQKDIYACGDCTYHPNKVLNTFLRLESVHNAIEQSKTVANNILGIREAYRQIPWFWSDQYDHRLQIVGISGNHEKIVMRGSKKKKNFMMFYFKNDNLIAVNAINNPKDFLICRKLLEKEVKIGPEKISDQSINLNDLEI